MISIVAVALHYHKLKKIKLEHKVLYHLLQMLLLDLQENQMLQHNFPIKLR